MRLLNTVSTLAIVAAGALPTSAVYAQAANVTPSSVNILNLLSPFLALNSTTIGQTTLQQNLATAIAINNNATATQQQLAISDKNLLNAASNAVAGVGNVGVAANLAGGLPAQTPVTGTDGSITPIQPVGGLGAVLGPIYQRGVAPVAGGTPILANTVALLTGAYTNFTSNDLGAAKFYFANGTINGTTPDVAPAGFTLPTANGLPNGTNSVYDIAYGVKNTDPNQDVFGSSRPVQVTPTGINQFDSTSIAGLTTNPSFPSGHTTYAYTDSILLAMLVPQDYQNMLLRAATYANSRIVLGVHYPLDIIASRALASYDLSQAFTNAAYMSNAATTGVAVNLPASYNAAKP
ncbi:phosphatase PAP2 family protein, partial [Beijerinckia sp. L45]|uniref:phosphatase PAP2 family protein n=1 Tax=Beijerinckia sp. L45 TaxID=1641855 RepID=UPI00131CDDC4